MATRALKRRDGGPLGQNGSFFSLPSKEAGRFHKACPLIPGRRKEAVGGGVDRTSVATNILVRGPATEDLLAKTHR